MIQENKDLLLKDLCARFPYRPRVRWKDIDVTLTIAMFPIVNNGAKPYLRSISSMTEEEKIESLNFAWEDDYGRLASYNENIPKYIDWLNAHHFDYRGLIEKSLAIEVTKDNNPYE